MQDDRKPIANAMLVLREEFDDWAILFDPETGKTFGLNPVSVHIWKILDGKRTLEDISCKVRKAFAGIPAEMDEHIRQFVSSLEEKGLVGFEK